MVSAMHPKPCIPGQFIYGPLIQQRCPFIASDGENQGGPHQEVNNVTFGTLRRTYCAKLLYHTSKVLKINEVSVWTDSTVVLGWLQSSPRRFKPSVGTKYRRSWTSSHLIGGNTSQAPLTPLTVLPGVCTRVVPQKSHMVEWP